jgi:hypothetical protein
MKYQIQLFCPQDHTVFHSLATSYYLNRKMTAINNLNKVMEQSIYIETSVRNKCRCSFYCALLTLHVSAPIDGHLQVALLRTEVSIYIDWYTRNRMHNPIIKVMEPFRKLLQQLSSRRIPVYCFIFYIRFGESVGESKISFHPGLNRAKIKVTISLTYFRQG